MVFNHGSEPLPGDKADQAAFYVSHGFVLFVPHRRGHGRSRDAGDYIVELVRHAGDDPKVLVRELEAQVDDVMAAVAYVAKLPFVDPQRIVMAGCSFGGIETLLAAERGQGIVAAVDFAGAAIMWKDTPLLQERMQRAARGARVPVFFLQAENDFDTTPSLVLSAEMRAAGRPSRVHIFPPNGTTRQDGHGFCRGGERPAWGDEVLAFLNENMPRPGDR
jgi:dipeptidyl aminopeptidase/acylaminoacyl peptidase